MHKMDSRLRGNDNNDTKMTEKSIGTTEIIYHIYTYVNYVDRALKLYRQVLRR